MRSVITQDEIIMSYMGGNLSGYVFTVHQVLILKLHYGNRVRVYLSINR